MADVSNIQILVLSQVRTPTTPLFLVDVTTAEKHAHGVLEEVNIEQKFGIPYEHCLPFKHLVSVLVVQLLQVRHAEP